MDRTIPVADLAGRALRSLSDARLSAPPLTLRFWDGSELPAGAAGGPREPATVVIRRPEALGHLLHEPNQIGLARAWVDGSLEVEGELERVLSMRQPLREVRLTAADWLRLALVALAAGGAKVLRRPPVPAIEARAVGRRHSLRRDRRAISHHYEISNRFYELMLGKTMAYSCAYFDDPDESLEAAQTRKLETICRKLRLRAGERLLDVGCGWARCWCTPPAIMGCAEWASPSRPRRPRWPARGSPPPAWSGCSRCASATTESCVRAPTTRSPASACTSTSAAPTSAGTSPRCMRCCARAAVSQPRHLLGSAHAFQTAGISVFQVLGARYGAPHRLSRTRRELGERAAEAGPPGQRVPVGAQVS